MFYKDSTAKRSDISTSCTARDAAESVLYFIDNSNNLFERELPKRMALNKYGISVECENCTCVRKSAANGFNIDVPVRDRATGFCGNARIHCSVSADGHAVELADWQTSGADQSDPSEEMQERVSAILDYVAEHHICGNRNICPAEVAEFINSRTPG